ncbi:MAG: MgtC/SapB family protein [Pseudonocardia sp.]|nr:MgtC/SapB family protein [Pseudonocardia sp.]
MVLPVALAMVLTTAIGVEREAGAKSAGLRTHTLVGVGSALFMLVSKYGFFDLLGIDHVALDPSRTAAQVVSGIGFIATPTAAASCVRCSPSAPNALRRAGPGDRPRDDRRRRPADRGRHPRPRGPWRCHRARR